MLVDYLSTMAVLFIGYLFVRLAIMDATRLPPEPSRPMDFDGKGIDATEIAGRVRQVREQIAEAKTSPPCPSFKRASRVESRRAQISGLAYFQKPPASAEPTETEHQMHLLLV